MKNLHDYWRELTAGLPADRADAARREFAAIAVCYDEGHRRYHNRAHLEELFALYEGCKHLMKDREAVIAAVFYHDLVYNPRSSVNEEESARRAVSFLPGLGFSPAFAERVGEMVLCTKTHDCPEDDGDAKLFIDMDMAILGSDPARYRAYARAVREEYSCFDDRTFYGARLNRFLIPTLSKPRLFLTDLFENRYGEQARKNMAEETAVIEKSWPRRAPGPCPG